MNKRWVSLTLAGLMALSAAALAACGDEEEKVPAGDTGPQGEQQTPPPPAEELTPAPAYPDAQATLTLQGKVNKDNAKNAISSELFGLFLEDINYASYALDDNMVENGSFEYLQGGTLTGWTGTNASIARKSGAESLSSSAPNYAEVNVQQAGGSLTNSGYYQVPMFVQKGEDYLFSAFIKGYAGEVTVSVKAGADTVAEGSFTVEESDSWVKYQKTVTATSTKATGVTMQIAFSAADDSVLLDGVALETLDATAGIKNYMYEPMHELSPAFFRFPGGCVIEGKNFAGAYDWKNSIGAAAEGEKDVVPELTYTLVKDGVRSEVTTRGEQVTRKANTDIWENGSYYEMEYGIGFYEYFLLCESMNATAIPIVNCGLSCQIQTPNGAVPLQGRHGKGVADYIQDALDLVAFAKGSTSSSDANEKYWAQVRADMGHPEPFDMHYLGIGNEQWGTYFSGYYEKFLEAFKEKAQTNPLYGTVELIVGNGPNFQYDVEYYYDGGHREGTAQQAANAYLSQGKIEKIADYGIVDQHYYMNYTDFFEAADMYDSYKRPGGSSEKTYYNVFVGEYSANTNFTRTEFQSGGKFSSFDYTQNSWLTALAEAAYMTGLERNGDIVKLAAYAPMFGMKDLPNQWAVDMMFFTNSTLTRTPNYFVQQIFMQNSGDYKVNAKLEPAEGTSLPQTMYSGFAGKIVSNVETEDKNTPVTRTFDDIYFVTSKDEETGDILVKIVNAGAKAFKLNVKFDMTDCTLSGSADIITLSSDKVDTTHEKRETVKPKTTAVGGFTENTLGFTAAAYSVNCIRLHTK